MVASKILYNLGLRAFLLTLHIPVQVSGLTIKNLGIHVVTHLPHSWLSLRNLGMCIPRHPSTPAHVHSLVDEVCLVSCMRTCLHAVFVLV